MLNDKTSGSFEGTSRQADPHDLQPFEDVEPFDALINDVETPFDAPPSAIDVDKTSVQKKKTVPSERPPGDINRLLGVPPKGDESENASQKPGGRSVQQEIKVETNTHRLVNNVNILCSCSTREHTPFKGSLVDRGANGGIAGSDMRVTCQSDCIVDMRGIDNHRMNNVLIVSAGGVVSTDQGDVIIVCHQCACMSKGKFIHFSEQFEHCQNMVDDRARKVGGEQVITALDGYHIPLNVRNGLPHMFMRPHTDKK